MSLRHIHSETQKQRGCDRYGVVADPGHGQIGKDFLVFVECTASVPVARCGQNVLLAQNYALRFARCARRVQKNCRIFWPGPMQEVFAPMRIFVEDVPTHRG